MDHTRCQGPFVRSYGFEDRRLLLAQKQIHNPTSPHMRRLASAMGNERLIVATGIHQGIGKNGHSVEGSLVIYGLRKVDDGGREPASVDGDGAEEVAEDVAE